MDLQIQIRPEVKKSLMAHTSELDVADVSRETGLGYHTVRRLRLCELEINNAERANAVKQLAVKALSNSEKFKDGISNDQILLEETIKTLTNKNNNHEKSSENI
ncbi:MAG TPA: hypothetical protein DCQ68_18825 [Chryseobacterium indologenes]|nr:hypothetical protein [Chryseobacterium indologenes]